MRERLAGVVLDCTCGLRYMRDALELPAIESARAYCPCERMLGEWHGLHRLVFEAEDARLTPTVSFVLPH